MSKKNRDKNLVEKVGKLKDKQDKWMQERADSKTLTSKKFVHSTLRSSDSSKSTHLQQKTAQKQQDVRSKVEAVPWTTNNSNYKGFVVRNGSGTSKSRQESSRTPSSSKIFTHSSLKENVTSRPISARSSNFKHSKYKAIDINENEADADSDESLSASFTKHMSNLEFDDYDSKKYSKEPNCVEEANTKKTKYMVNHFCPACKQIMLNEDDRKPQMVFPCGHSFCGNCLKGKKKCLDCNTEIISYQPNQSLLMVIQQFKQKIDREELELKEKQTRGFIDEYKNLNSRIGILKGNIEIKS